ncbi:MAG: cysteine hydrolase family protein [Chloroflexota bacterium]
MSTHSALLIIDAQVGLLDGAHQSDRVVERIAGLARRARTAETPIVYLQHDGDDDGSLAPGSPGWRIHPALAPQPEDAVLRKRASDSFFETPLAEVLRNSAIDRLIVTGMKTEMCVDTTSRQAVSRGYDVLLVSDAHTTTDSDVLSAEQIIAHHNDTLDDFGTDDHVVTVAPAAEVTL